MRLSNFTDYSLRVLMYLAVKEEELSTVSEISEKFGISYNHLIKVVHNLSKLNLISTYKGRGGGICLNASPREFNVGKIIKTLEESSLLIECIGDKNFCRIEPVCVLKKILVSAQESFYATLEKFTLEDLLKNKSLLSKSLNI